MTNEGSPNRWIDPGEEAGGPLAQALMAARKSLAGAGDLDGAAEALLAAGAPATAPPSQVHVPAEPPGDDRVVIDLRPATPSPPPEREPESGSDAAADDAATVTIESEREATSSRPQSGSLWRHAAQGWVRDETGRLVWRPIVTTTVGVANWDIDTNLGIVTGESACAVEREGLGEMIATVAGNAAIRSQLAEDREQALGAMVEAAVARGAHGVIGVDVEYTFLGECLVVTATGTAVTLKSPPSL